MFAFYHKSTKYYLWLSDSLPCRYPERERATWVSVLCCLHRGGWWQCISSHSVLSVSSHVVPLLKLSTHLYHCLPLLFSWIFLSSTKWAKLFKIPDWRALSSRWVIFSNFQNWEPGPSFCLGQKRGSLCSVILSSVTCLGQASRVCQLLQGAERINWCVTCYSRTPCTYARESHGKYSSSHRL